ncbi:penicillin acylase family protein [Niveispirillum lacus]|uniref:penicillin acylase family protein n=1 Tax=Niveispirillum lacus TaxID=1981099 RepID=UPI0013FE3806|nr:penicillin acylase family protein [Niveispirillum lacus]
MRRRHGRRQGFGWGRALRYGAAGVAGLVLVAAGAFTVNLFVSKPALDGSLALNGLTAPVAVSRDAQGIPTLTGDSRLDLARALGFLHAQERYFQMDLIRRSAAGELSGLLGPVGPVLEIDRSRRLHRLRHRAEQVIAGLPADQKSMLEAYADGVNQGLAAINGRPFEYALLLATPQPWTTQDTILAAYAMYLDLQDEDALTDRIRGQTLARLGPEMTDFLYPRATSLDAPIDGLPLPEPALPSALPALGNKTAMINADPGPTIGSNAWAVGGALTANGAALVADDMHLGISVPGTWYRARLLVRGGPDAMDATGVTLPGTPALVAGSNGKVAWGYTNSYIDTADVIVLEPAEGTPGRYHTPEGPKELTRVRERLCPAWVACQDMVVEESIWGPVVETRADGSKLAVRWTGHEPDAINLTGLLGLERAESVDAAIAIAHRARQPQQNLVVGDTAGNVAWTIIGAVPARFGHDGSIPSSWADGTRGWNGMLPPDQIPVIRNPDHHRIWTANARIVGGDAYAKLGDGGYDMGGRQAQIRDGLFSRDRFGPAEMLAIQLDDRALVLGFWQEQMLAALMARPADARLAALAQPVRDWGARAATDSVGYRLVRAFRTALAQKLYSGYLGLDGPMPRNRSAAQQEGPLRRLMTERPPALVPPGYKDWDALVSAALTEVADQVDKAGGIQSFTWGARNVAEIRHPLARILPPVGWLTDPPEQGLPGDSMMPRVQGPGFGASQRFAVAPGHEAEAYFHMPGSQSGHPLSPYYLQGHQDWADGKPTPFLPGPTRWTLTLEPE